MIRTASTALLALFVVCGAAETVAFPVFYAARGDIAPWAPTPGDHVILSISDTLNATVGGAGASARPDAVQISQEGNQISVLAHWVADATGGNPYAFQVDLGALPVGEYTVIYSQGPNVGNSGWHYVSVGFSVSVEGYATAVEYFAPSLGHYFVTSESAEIAALDNGTIPGWTRTGESFHVIPAAVQPTTAASVCRFYGLPQAGLNSHFFTSLQSECDAVQQLWPSAWLLETADAFAVLPVPQVDCAQGAVSLYRLYNNRPDANHRFTTSPVTRDQMVAKGWILEGSATQHGITAMCVPE
jgi:hypothetical protein